MKKIQIIPISIIVMLIAHSCSKIEPVVDYEVGAFYVSKQMAEDYVAQSNIRISPLIFYEGDPVYNTQLNKLDQTHTIKDEKGKAIFHILSYQKGGFAIVSADSRVAPLLAYSEWNPFNPQAKNYPAGLVNWLSKQKERIQHVRNTGAKQSELIKAEWEPISIVNNFWNSTYQSNYGYVGGSIICADLRRQFGPLLFGDWRQIALNTQGQEVGYVWYTDIHIPTGWTPNELYDRWQVDSLKGQYRHGNVYFRDLMPETDSIWVLSKNEYIHEGSLKDEISKIEAALHQFKIINMQPDKIQPWGQFRSELPLQSWYCDGYHAYQRWHGDCDTGFATYSNFLHMNWGWRGAFDGWFSTADLYMP